MPDRIEELLRKFPDGLCTPCLTRRDSQSPADIDALIDRYLSDLPLHVSHGVCPECGGVGRIVRLSR
jgi:hypothetical protein